ncbi:hypothetical protein [Rhizomonospora bruguierae]|uniref:hypothetical protein n=1 Tax=Rhizomonospora bruguierae TaxID=1581705 RepID=UPI001BCC1D93|nr:hypothetical protein [Micromonospora sp. NBRC 107566]
MTVRTAVILLLAFIIGLLAGGMSYLVDPSVPAAVLVGGGAAGSALLLFHSVIEP